MARLPGAEFYNLYGQTGEHVDATTSGTRLQTTWRAPIGRPLPNFVYALDERGSGSTAKVRRELHVRGASVAQGYWGDRGACQSFVENPFQKHYAERTYRTGDLVSLDSQGEYVFRGRKDHLIKSRGYRIELDEIENVLRSHPAICEAAVVPLPDEQIGNRILAFVVPATNVHLGAGELQLYLGERLPRYMLPESITVRDSMPLTSTAKIDKQRLIAASVGPRGDRT
jgi:acyl-coenzyme A synthetase/AMP-(fatty) acid ligase